MNNNQISNKMYSLKTKIMNLKLFFFLISQKKIKKIKLLFSLLCMIKYIEKNTKNEK